ALAGGSGLCAQRLANLGNRPQTQILFPKTGRQKGPAPPPGTMANRSWRPGPTLEVATCMNLEIHEARRAGSSLAQAARPGYRRDGMSAACRAALPVQLFVH